MASKDVIQINKLKIGSSGITGLYVGNTESKYAVMTDSAKTQTVIYDKVKYNFVVNDYSGSVPASGATLNITGTSTKTHGNGVVEQVEFSPTSVTVPANTGSSYSSSVTVTQGTSNLTDAYNYTVAGDAVKSISLTISNPATIPAAGGSVNTCTTAATVTYNSGRQVTSFTPTSVNFNTVSAGTKGTTVSDVTTAGTLTCYIVFGGVTSNTASVYVKQAANAVTSYTDYQAPTGLSISASKVPASGGTSTITWSGTCKQDAKAVYTSTATASTYTNLTISSPTKSISGNSAVASKGSTISNETTAIATVTGTYTANGKSSTTTTSVKQNANYVTKVEATGVSSTSHFSYANITAGATSASIAGTGGAYYTFTSGSRVLDSSGSPSFGGTATYTRSNYTLAASQNGFTAVNSSNGTLTATSLGTTISNARTSANVSAQLVVTYTHASSYSAGGTVTSAAYTSTATCTQNGNYVTSISVSSVGLAYDVIPASGGSKTPTGSNGTVTYTFSSTSTSTTAPASTYGSLTTTPSYAMTASGRFTLKSTSTGEVSATTKGTSVEGITSSDTITKTVNCTWTPTASYNAAGTKTASGTATGKATQAANAVTGYVDYQNPTGKSISGSQVPASGGTSTITWAGTCKQQAKAVYTSNSTASSYTELTISSPSTTVTGNNAVSSKGTTVSNVTTAQTVTGYYWANGKTASTNCYVTQAANAVTNTAYGNVTITSPSNNASLGEIAASGGSKVPTRTATQTITYTFTSTSTSSSTKTTGYSWTTDKAAGASIGSGFYCVNDGSSIPCAISAETRGTTAGDARTSNALTLTCTGEGSKSASVTYYATQAKNEIVSYTDYGTPTGKSISGSQVPAAGGTSTITWSGTPEQTRKPVYTSTATGSSVSFTPTISTAVTGNSAVGSKGTTVSNVTTALTVTGYYWANGKTASTSCYVTQAANAVVSYTDYGALSGKSISGSQVPAAGGTSTITWSGTPSQTRKPVYTSTSTGSSETFTPSISTAITGNNEVASKGTTISDVTTAQTVTGYYWANGKTASTNCYVTQAANSEGTTEMNAGNSGWTATISIGNGITAAGGSATVTANASHIHYYRHQYTSGSYTGWYTPTVTDTASVTEDSDPNNRYSYSNGTLTHSNMTTNATTDSCTLRVRNASNTATTNTASVSVTNQIESTKYNEGNSAYTATISIGNGITAAGGSATVTASAGHTHYWQQKYTSGSYVASWYTSSVSDTASVTEDSDPNNRYSYSNGTLTHSSMGTYVGTDTCTLRVRNASNTATTNTASVSATNAEGTTEMNAGNSAYTASISIGNGITAGGGSATVTASAGHTHYYRHQYTSGSYTGWYTNSVTDTATVTEDSDPNNRYSYSNGTLTHSNMTTNVTTDSCTLRVRNASNTATTDTASVSVSNAEGTTEMDAGNSAWTATISIGNGITAAGGSATVSASAGHTHYYRHQYTSGSYTGWYTNSVSDTADVSEDSDPNNRYSYSNGTLTHSSMGTSETTDTCTLRVRNHSNTATTNTTSVSVTNSRTRTDGNSGYTASISIGSGLSAGGGSATVSASGSHTYWYYDTYSSGSRVPASGVNTSTQSDGASWEITSNGNSRFSKSGNVLSHSSMGTTATTDTVYVKATNSNNSGATAQTYTSIVNEVTNSNYDAQSYWANISIGSGLSAAGGSATVSATAGHQARYYYTSGSYTDLGARSDSATWTITSNGNSRFSQNGNTLSHSSMGTAATTDTVVVKATNSSNSSATAQTSTSIVNEVTNSNYDAQSYWASVTIGTGLSAAGGSATVTASAGHQARYYYTSGSYTGLAARTDGATWTITSNGNSRFSQNGNTLNHSSMTTNETTDTVVVKATNSSNSSATGDTSASVTNSRTRTDGNSGYTASITIGNGITAAGGSATVTASAGHTYWYYDTYSSGSRVPASGVNTAAQSDGVTVTEQSDNNNRYSYSNGTLTHSSMGTSETTDSCTLRATNNSNSSAYKDASVSVTNSRTRTDGNSGYTASITIGNGITAAGGSATVTASAGHTYWYYDTYSSGSRVPTSGVNTSAQSDGVTVTEQADNNNRYSYSNGTLTHSSMGTSETTDTCTLRATNNSSSSAYKDASVSVTNSRTRTDGNSGYTASISIGSGLSAAGGSATVSASGGHTYWYYDSYSSGSRVPTSGVNTSTQSDGASWEITSNGNSRFSKSGNVLSHSSMGTSATTDTVYVKATNTNNSSATAQTYTSIVNQVTNSDYDAQSYTVDISIGSGIVASGGSATVTTSAGHQARYYYTSGSYTALGARTDGVSVTEVVDNNNRYSYSNGTLSHSNMTTNVTTDRCTLRATNASNSSTYKDASVGVTNYANYVEGGYSGFTPGTNTITLNSGVSNPATGGSATITTSPGSETHYYYYYYTSGSHVPASETVSVPVDEINVSATDMRTESDVSSEIHLAGGTTTTWGNIGDVALADDVKIIAEVGWDSNTSGIYYTESYLYITNDVVSDTWAAPVLQYEQCNLYPNIIALQETTNDAGADYWEFSPYQQRTRIYSSGYRDVTTYQFTSTGSGVYQFSVTVNNTTNYLDQYGEHGEISIGNGFYLYWYKENGYYYLEPYSDEDYSSTGLSSVVLFTAYGHGNQTASGKISWWKEPTAVASAITISTDTDPSSGNSLTWTTSYRLGRQTEEYKNIHVYYTGISESDLDIEFDIPNPDYGWWDLSDSYNWSTGHHCFEIFPFYTEWDLPYIVEGGGYVVNHYNTITSWANITVDGSVEDSVQLIWYGDGTMSTT